jgi:NAD(P)H-hydrate repair Nnr-like enzyme with NAD(P)H-hydrate dehydratase domain
VTVLKGCGSVIATPDGRWYVNGSGNPGLASAGTGDVLSGIIASLLAQGLSAKNAALLGVYLHGASADSLVAAGVGPIGLTATELMPETRDLLNRWMTES